MSTKICFKCNSEKSLSEFYPHKRMADGYLNKCKTCTKGDIKKRESLLKNNPEWIEKEKERGRDKYHRLYVGKHSGTNQAKAAWIKRNPEKRKAHNAVQNLNKPEGTHWHHWSYNEEHWKDVILLSIADHAKVHRFLQYDPETKFFKTRDGTLLSSHTDHLNFIKTI